MHDDCEVIDLRRHAQVLADDEDQQVLLRKEKLCIERDRGRQQRSNLVPRNPCGRQQETPMPKISDGVDVSEFRWA